MEPDIISDIGLSLCRVLENDKKKENKQDVGVGGSEPKRTERY